MYAIETSRAAGDRSGRKYTEKYVSMSTNLLIGTMSNYFKETPKLIENDFYFQR